MTPEEKAKDLCDYLFRIGKHADKKVEFDPEGYVAQAIRTANPQDCRRHPSPQAMRWAAPLGIMTAIGLVLALVNEVVGWW